MDSIIILRTYNNAYANTILYSYLYISRLCSRFRFGLTKFSNKKINGRGGTDHVPIPRYSNYILILHCYTYYTYTTCLYDAAVLAVTERSLCVGPTGRGPNDKRFAHAQASVCGSKAAGRANFSVSVIPVLLSNQHRFHGCTLNT